MIHFALTLVLTGTLMVQSTADLVVEAFNAEQTNPANRTIIDWTTPDGSAAKYTIERDAAGTTRFVSDTPRERIEYFVVPGFYYARENNVWRKYKFEAVKVPASILPDLPGFLRSNLTDVRELPARVTPSGRFRVFQGAVAWPGADGEMEILLDAGAGQLAHVSFKGQCGTRDCGFEQALEHDPALQVSPPAVP